MSDESTTLNMGYGGCCAVDWKTESLVMQTKEKMKEEKDKQNLDIAEENQIFITNGNIGVTYNRPTENTYKAPRDTKNVIPILLSPGTASISGSVSFDMSHKNLSYFLDTNRLKRNTYFHLVMSTGGNCYAVYHNMWNSFSISASAGGLVTCNIGYMSLNCFSADIHPATLKEQQVTNTFDHALVAYWQAGTQGYVQSFTINITQDVTPVYLNNDEIMPSYLRSGSLKVNANIQSCISWQNIDSVINYTGNDEGGNGSGNNNNNENNSGNSDNGKFKFSIGSKIFTLNNTVLSSKQYTHNGAGDVQKFSYSVQSLALTSPDEEPFTIS